MQAESQASGDNQIVYDVVTLASVLQILAAPVAHGRDDRHIAELAQESACLRALAGSGVADEELRTRALNAITLAGNTVVAQLREILPDSSGPSSNNTAISRLKTWLGGGRLSVPPHAPALPDDELQLVRRSSEQLLIKLEELRLRFVDNMPPVASGRPVAHRVHHKHPKVSATR